MRFEGVSRVEQRLDMVLAPERYGLTVRETCALWGVSPDTFYRWRARYADEGLDGLEDRSSRPARSPGRIDAALEHQIVALRQAHPRWGPRRLRAELRRRGHEQPPARSTIERVLWRNGLMDASARAVPATKPLRRFVRSAPNELWQTDAMEWPLPDGSIVQILSVLDDHSRLCCAATAFATLSGEHAIAAFDTAAEAYGLPHSVLSDRGSIFTGISKGCVVAFERHLWQLGVCTLNGHAYHPQTQGKIERYHRTLIEWFVDHPCRTISALTRELAAFRDDYNNERPHQSLDDHTPAEIWNRTPKAVPDPAGTIERRQRETLRTTSDNGNVRYGEWTIALGRNWAHTKVRVIADATTITCRGPNDEHIRTVNPDPTRTYLGTGKPRGRPRRRS